MKIDRKLSEDDAYRMTGPVRTWWWSAWSCANGPKQPRLTLLQFAMNSETRPTAPEETIAYGYVNNRKFHDREPGIVLAVMEAADAWFFKDFPRDDFAKPMTDAHKRAVIGMAARTFYRCGQPGYRDSSNGQTPPMRGPLAHDPRAFFGTPPSASNECLTHDTTKED